MVRPSSWRGGGGILVNRFDTTAGVWIAKNPGPPLSDQEGWNQPQYYTTIQLADIDGNPGAELLGRGGAGIPATGAWIIQQTPSRTR